tara:strand:- start:45 stop:242 length:198 start_codon:yes stop_codon:yes gene_type:complete
VTLLNDFIHVVHQLWRMGLKGGNHILGVEQGNTGIPKISPSIQHRFGRLSNRFFNKSLQGHCVAR